jgi:hypothetical protein
MEAFFDLCLAGCIEEETYCFLEIKARFLDRVALTGNVDLRAERDIAIALALYEGYSTLRTPHVAPHQAIILLQDV